MTDIPDTIIEYKRSCDKLEKRIDQLNTEINNLLALQLPLGNLIQRRYILYNELIDIQGAIRSLEEYLPAYYRSREKDPLPTARH